MSSIANDGVGIVNQRPPKVSCGAKAVEVENGVRHSEGLWVWRSRALYHLALFTTMTRVSQGEETQVQARRKPTNARQSFA